MPCQAQGLASKWPGGQRSSKDHCLCRVPHGKGLLPAHLPAAPMLTHICFQMSFPAKEINHLNFKHPPFSTCSGLLQHTPSIPSQTQRRNARLREPKAEPAVEDPVHPPVPGRRLLPLGLHFQPLFMQERPSDLSCHELLSRVGFLIAACSL